MFNNNTPASEQVERAHATISVISDFLEFAKDPQKLTDLHEAARKELELTSDKATKYQEAIAFMAQYEQLSTAYEADHTALEAAKTKHSDFVRGKGEEFKIEGDRLAAQKSEQETLQGQLDNRGKKLEDDWKEMERKYSEAMTPIDDARAQNEKDAEENKTEKERLEKLRIRLEARAAKFKDAVTDEDEAEETPTSNG